MMKAKAMNVVKVNTEKCSGCSYCVIGCPQEAIALNVKKEAIALIDKSKCTDCEECISLCPNNAIDRERES
jgi:ferredoxin